MKNDLTTERTAFVGCGVTAESMIGELPKKISSKPNKSLPVIREPRGANN